MVTFRGNCALQPPLSFSVFLLLPSSRISATNKFALPIRFQSLATSCCSARLAGSVTVRVEPKAGVAELESRGVLGL